MGGAQRARRVASAKLRPRAPTARELARASIASEYYFAFRFLSWRARIVASQQACATDCLLECIRLLVNGRAAVRGAAFSCFQREFMHLGIRIILHDDTKQHMDVSFGRQYV